MNEVRKEGRKMKEDEGLKEGRTERRKGLQFVCEEKKREGGRKDGWKEGWKQARKEGRKMKQGRREGR